MLGVLLLVVACCGTPSRAQEGEVIVPLDNKTQCINQMSGWCDKMQYPQQGAGLAVLSLTYEDPGGLYQVFCSSDSGGTNCTRNREPWFTCSPDHVLTYRGRVLTNASADVDGICETADKAFNELFVQNLSYENTTLKTEVQEGMEAFFEQMAAMEEQIALIQRLLKRLPSIPDDLWRDFENGFLPQESADTMVTTAFPGGDNYMQSSTEQQSNQIEKQ